MQHRAWRRAVADPTCGNRMMLRNSRNGARRSGLVGFRSTAHPVTAEATVPAIPTASSTNARISPRRIHTSPEPDSIATGARLRLGSSAAPQPPSSPQTDDPAAPDCRPTCLSTRALRARSRPQLSLPPHAARPPSAARPHRGSSTREETAVVQPAERPMTEDLLRSRGSPGVSPRRGRAKRARSRAEADALQMVAGAAKRDKQFSAACLARCRERTRWRTTIRGRGVFLSPQSGAAKK